MAKNKINWDIHDKVKRSLKMLSQRCKSLKFEQISGLIGVASEQKNRRVRLVYILNYYEKYLKILKEIAV